MKNKIKNGFRSSDDTDNLDAFTVTNGLGLTSHFLETVYPIHI